MNKKKLCAYHIFTNIAEREWKKGNYEQADRLEKIATGISRSK